MVKDHELLEAAKLGKVDAVVKILSHRRSGPFASLRRGPGANIQDSCGYTPLHYAALNGHVDIVELLLAADASPSMLDQNGSTPLHLAAWQGNVDVVRCLLAQWRSINVDLATKNKGTALHCAAWSGHTEVVSQLLTHGADPLLKNNDGETPLDLAAQYGRLDTVRHLLKMRPDLVDQYRSPAALGRTFTDTPLHRASRNGHEQVVALLLVAGVGVNIRTNSSNQSFGTALHDAALRGKVAVVQTLLEHRANVDIVNTKNQTVLQLLEPFRSQVHQSIKSLLLRYRQSSGYNSGCYESDFDDDYPPIPVDHSPLYDNRMAGDRRSSSDLETMPSPDSPKIRDHFTNKSSSSAFIRNHSNKFVKRITSKCLGLKAKFNSAPNISNTGLGPKVEVRSKPKHSQNDHRAKVTSTLHIGNSKFFKILAKKNIEPVDVVCNDEFDTISLDRLVPMDRLSINNRSNRSCPGFKASLPNISENTELSDSGESIVRSTPCAQIALGATRELFTETYNSAVRVRTPLPYAIPESELMNHGDHLSTESCIKIADAENEFYESYLASVKKETERNGERAVPPKRQFKTLNVVYENVSFENRVATPRPQTRKLAPLAAKFQSGKEPVYVNLPEFPIHSVIPVPTKRTINDDCSSKIASFDSLEETTSDVAESSISSSRTSTMSLDTKIDNSNFEDILLSKKSKSFRKSIHTNGKTVPVLHESSDSSSESSSVVGESNIEDIDSSTDDETQNCGYVSMSRTMPRQKTKPDVVRKLFRNETFDAGKRNNEHLVNYHIRGTGHCIYQAPTIEEFVYVFNKDTLKNEDVPPFSKISNIRDSSYETAICFCRPDELKHHKSADDLVDIMTLPVQSEESPKVIIDMTAFERSWTSFRCYCVDGSCTLHYRREGPSLAVKFHALKKSISTPDLGPAPSVPLENPYAIVDLASVSYRQNNNTDTTQQNSTYHNTASRQDSDSSNDTSLTFGALSEGSAFCTLPRSVSAGSSSSDTLRGSVEELSVASLDGGPRATDGAGCVRSGSRRRWDEGDVLSEADALSMSSAASGSLPQRMHYHHHRGHNKVSPTPPKKPPRRNLSVSPTHANSPGSYEYLRTHARSQDDLDDLQEGKHSLKHGRSVDQYVDGKHSYSNYDSSPRVAPIPKPRPSLKPRCQPVAITAMYENVVIKEQNPRRKLRRNPTHQYENFEPVNMSTQEKSSLESLLDSQSMNSPDERYCDGSRVPLSPTHYDQPPTPDHPPPSARIAENSIHERIRPLSQLIMELIEEKRRAKLLANSKNGA